MMLGNIFGCLLTMVYMLLGIFMGFVYDSPYAGGLFTDFFAYSPLFSIAQTLIGILSNNFLLILTSWIYPFIGYFLVGFKDGKFTKKDIHVTITI